MRLNIIRKFFFGLLVWSLSVTVQAQEEKILFPCDLFGSHLATNDLFVYDEGLVLREAKRYYAQIMMPFSKLIKKHLARLEKMEIQVVAPSHGPIHDKPETIIDSYREWVMGEPKNTVVLPYVSMHGSTRLMVERLMEDLVSRGVRVEPFNMAEADPGKLAMALVDAATVVFGTPTVLGGPHPKVVYAAYLAGALRPKTRFMSAVCSYGWGGKAIDQLKGLTENLKAEFIEPVLIKGAPSGGNFEAVESLAVAIEEKHATAGLK